MTISDAPARAPALPQMGRVEYGLIALQSMLWGSTFFFVAWIGAAMPALTMSAIRLVPAVVVLMLVVGLQRLRYPANLRDWGLIFGLAALNNVVPFVMITTAQREVTGGVAAVFNATAPLFAIFLAALAFADERLSWRRVAGIVTGIVGVALLVGGGTASTSAMALLLGAAFCYALANVVTRRWLSAQYPPFMIAASHMIAALVLASLGAVLIDQPWRTAPPSAMTVATVAVMGLLGSAFASLCHFTILARAGATNAMLVTIVLPLTPIILGALFLGERLAPREILGALVVALALIIIDGRALRWLRPSGGRSA